MRDACSRADEDTTVPGSKPVQHGEGDGLAGGDVVEAVELSIEAATTTESSGPGVRRAGAPADNEGEETFVGDAGAVAGSCPTSSRGGQSSGSEVEALTASP